MKRVKPTYFTFTFTFIFTTWHNKSKDCNIYQSTSAIYLYNMDGEREDESDAVLAFCNTRWMGEARKNMIGTVEFRQQCHTF
jgi:hypothetical protein